MTSLDRLDECRLARAKGPKVVTVASLRRVHAQAEDTKSTPAPDRALDVVGPAENVQQRVCGRRNVRSGRSAHELAKRPKARIGRRK